MKCPFYNDIHGILGTRDIVRLPEVREVGVNQDNHINPSGSITKGYGKSRKQFLR